MTFNDVNWMEVHGYKKKLATRYTGVSKLFRGIEVKCNFHKNMEVKDSDFGRVQDCLNVFPTPINHEVFLIMRGRALELVDKAEAARATE